MEKCQLKQIIPGFIVNSDEIVWIFGYRNYDGYAWKFRFEIAYKVSGWFGRKKIKINTKEITLEYYDLLFQTNI